VFGHTWSKGLLVSTARDQRVIPVEGVDAGYIPFRKYRIVRGRDVAPLEVARTARVTVIGEELVEPFFGTEDPLGRDITIGGLHFRVVGVVAPFELELVPADFSFLARRLYVPYTYVMRYVNGGRRVDNVYIEARADADFPTVLRAGSELLKARHRGADDFEVENEAADVAEDLAMADGILLGWNAVLYTIAGVTMIVGGIGLFSVLLIAVRERVREIGIRMALGAAARNVRNLVLRDGLRMVSAGLLIGFAGAALVSRLLGSLLYGVSPLDPLTYAVIALLLGTVATLACLVPVRRALGTEPLEVLRHD
jgi:putative ABC transport system permease protein